jgi:hypothetical protein
VREILSTALCHPPLPPTLMVGDIGGSAEGMAWNAVLSNWSSKLSIDRNPRTLFGLHFIQLPLYSAILHETDGSSYDGENGYANGRSRGSTGKTILGVFFFAVGSALMRFAFYFGDDPKPELGERLLTWGTGIVAGLLISQGTILALSGNWLP